jgi:hypothetical protein
MRTLLLAAATAVAAIAAAPTAVALPTCTGVTQTVASGDAVPTSFLLTAGNCVEAGDKVFGDFSVTGAGSGSSNFFFLGPLSNVTLGFQGAIGPNTVATLHYQVAINPLITTAMRIVGLEKDFTLNSNVQGAPATATLTGVTNPLTNPAVAISCTRTVNPSTGDCPDAASFAPVLFLTIDETLTTGSNAVVTALTDTIFQAQIPEPAALGILGLGLLGLAAVRRRT